MKRTAAGRNKLRFGTAVVIVLAAGGVAAVAHIGTRQQPVFKGGVEVVLIDVNVVDRSHAPVSGLKPEDFVVTVDRKPRKVVSAQFLRYDVQSATTTEKRTVAVPAEPPPALPGYRPPARNVLIVIDNDSMEPGDGLAVRRESERFINRLAPDDRIGVVTIPRLRSVVTMSRNRDDVRKQIAGVITGSERYRGIFSISLGEALSIEAGDNDLAAKVVARNCHGAYPECPRDVSMEVRQIQIQEHLRGQRALDALQDIGESLRQVEGPKNVLYVTGGSPPPDLRSGTAYSRIEKAFAAGQITLYTLYVEQFKLGLAKTDFVPGVTSGGLTSETPMQDEGFEREGPENATAAAGGTFMHAIGTLDQYFDRVVAELSGSYLLGIEVESADRNGRPHQVKVSVNRKDVDVRARKEYVIDAEKTRLADASSKERETGEVIVPRSANPAANVAGTEEELRPVIERAGAYVDAYERQFLAILAEERSELKLSKWTMQGGKGAWALDRQRAVVGDYLLVKRPAEPGWAVFHDVFEVDGKSVRPRNGRLRTLFLNEPEVIFETTEVIRKESARYDFGFVDRSRNVPTAPLMFVQGASRDRFVFTKQSERMVDGTPIEELAFVERGSPTFLQGRSGEAPADGVFWVDPKQGRIVRTIARWDVDGARVEITVIYRGAANQPNVPWVPTEMREIYTTFTARLDCVTKYSNFRRFEAGG